MEHVIGIVTQLNGELVKRYFDGRPDAHLNLGDLILLDDSVWSRSLDAKATITLKNSQTNFKPGVRIKFDKSYLENVGSYDFLHDYELDEIRAKFGLYSKTNEKEHINSDENLPLNAFDEAEIFVMPLIGNGNVTPSLQNGVNLYVCNFNDIRINVKTMPEREVSLLDIDCKMHFAKNFANSEGDCFFELKHVKDDTKFGFTVLVFENGKEIFKQKIVIKIPKIDHQAAFSPIDVLDFDLVKNYDKSGVEFIDAIGIKIDAMKKHEEDYQILRLFIQMR